MIKSNANLQNSFLTDKFNTNMVRQVSVVTFGGASGQCLNRVYYPAVGHVDDTVGDSRKLKLSKMNMAGIGSKMMRHIMKKKNVESLESLRDMAIANGVEFIACQMSMDVMGVDKEELLDNVTIGGVATYMNRAEDSSLNLFI